MATQGKTWNVANRLHSQKDSDNPEVNHIIAGADEIYDDAKELKQSEHNAQTDDRLNEVETDLNASGEGIKDRVHTLEEQVAFEGDLEVENTPQGIVTGSGKVTSANAVRGAIDVRTGYFECLTASGTANKEVSAPGFVLTAGGSIKIKMTNANTVDNATLNINSTGVKALYYAGELVSASNTWEAGETVEVYYDGTSYYANNVAGGSGSGDGAFDVSAKYPTSGVEGGNTYTLEGALAVLNTNLSPNKKKGMSIKFVQSSDNKYVQCRYLLDDVTNSKFTNVANWQGVDDEPTAGSDNLVKSGGVFPTTNAIHNSLLPIKGKVSIIGDSISTFVGTTPDGYINYYPEGDLTSIYDIWWNLMLSLTESSLDVNASFGGSCVCSFSSGSVVYPSLYSRCGIIGNPDYVFIELGSNDSILNKPLGDYDYDSEIAELSETEFIPAYIKGIKALKQNYPHTEIVLLIFPMNEKYVDAIYNIGEYYSLNVIDVRSYYDKNHVITTVHPSKLGMGNVIHDIIRYYINNKVDDVPTIKSRNPVSSKGVAELIVEQESVDNIDSLPKSNTFVDGQGNWNNVSNAYKSVMIPIGDYNKISITAKSTTKPFQFAILTSGTYGTSGNPVTTFANGESVRILAAGSSITIPLGDNAKYICALIINQSVGVIPTSFIGYRKSYIGNEILSKSKEYTDSEITGISGIITTQVTRLDGRIDAANGRIDASNVEIERLNDDIYCHSEHYIPSELDTVDGFFINDSKKYQAYSTEKAFVLEVGNADIFKYLFTRSSRCKFAFLTTDVIVAGETVPTSDGVIHLFENSEDYKEVDIPAGTTHIFIGAYSGTNYYGPTDFYLNQNNEVVFKNSISNTLENNDKTIPNSSVVYRVNERIDEKVSEVENNRLEYSDITYDIDDFAGTDTQKVNAAIEMASKVGGGTVMIDRDIEINAAIILRSNVIVKFSGLIQMADEVFDNMFRVEGIVPNPNSPNGKCLEVYETRNIKLLGVGDNAVIKNCAVPYSTEEGGQTKYWIGDRYGWRTVTILFSNCKNYEIGGFHVEQYPCWCISQDYGCEYGYIHNIDFKETRLNTDAIDFRRGCYHMIVENITGSTGDDGIACTSLINGVDYGPYPLPMEPMEDYYIEDAIYDITIRNVSLRSLNCLDIITTTTKVHDIKVSDINDNGDIAGATPNAIVCILPSAWASFNVFGTLYNIFGNDIHSLRNPYGLRVQEKIKDCWFNKIVNEKSGGTVYSIASGSENVRVTNTD